MTNCNPFMLRMVMLPLTSRDYYISNVQKWFIWILNLLQSSDRLSVHA